MIADEQEGCAGEGDVDSAPGADDQAGTLLALERAGQASVVGEDGADALEVVNFAGSEGWFGRK